jgi:hypothetical protein
MARGFVARKGGVSMSNITAQDRVLLTHDALDGMLVAIALSVAMDPIEVRRLASTGEGIQELVEATERLRHDLVSRLRLAYQTLGDAFRLQKGE